MRNMNSVVNEGMIKSQGVVGASSDSYRTSLSDPTTEGRKLNAKAMIIPCYGRCLRHDLVRNFGWLMLNFEWRKKSKEKTIQPSNNLTMNKSNGKQLVKAKKMPSAWLFDFWILGFECWMNCHMFRKLSRISLWNKFQVLNLASSQWRWLLIKLMERY